MAALAYESPNVRFVLQHPTFAHLHQILDQKILMELVELPFPASRSGNSRIHCGVIDRASVPMRVEAYAADMSFAAFSNRLSYCIRAARRVLPNHYRNGAGI